jgi:hypothetical protein
MASRQARPDLTLYMRLNNYCIFLFLSILITLGCMPVATATPSSSQKNIKTPFLSITPRPASNFPRQFTLTATFHNIEPVVSEPPSPPTRKPILSNKCLDIAFELPQYVKPTGSLVFLGDQSYLMDFSTGYKTILGKGIYDISVSPDGKWIAYQKIGNQLGNYQLNIQSADDKQVKHLEWEKDWVGFIKWLNNHQLLISRQRDPLYSIIVLDPFSGDQRELIPDYPDLPQAPLRYSSFQFDTSNLVPDPFLKYIVYPQRLNGKFYIVLWDTQLSKPLAKLNDLNDFGHDPIWDKLGEDFVIPVTNQWDRNARENAIDEWFRINLNGEVQQLTHFGDQFKDAEIGTASLSPDGRFLAFWLVVRPSIQSTQSLAVLDLETETVINYCISGSGWSPVWSPDSRYIAIENDFAVNDDRIILVDTKDGWAVQIAQGPVLRPAGWMISSP